MDEQLTLRFDIPLALVNPDELYQNAEVYLELLREDRRFERKSPRTSPRSLGEYFSMWANTVPDGGLIAIGIEDGGSIVGCSGLSQTELNEREQAGRTYCPDARGHFRPHPEYPHDAWFEGVVNASVHRSYGMRNMHTTIEMFYDRMVIESPGGFPPFVTPENIYEVQHARNPKLMDAMFYLGYVKFANEGTKRIRDEMLANELPAPIFEQKDVAGGHSVRVTLRNNYKHREPWIDSDVSRILGDALSQSLSPEESRAINFVAQHGRINVSQLHDLVSGTVKTWHTCRKILIGLVEKEILEYKHRTDIQKDPKGHFILAERFRKAK